MAVTNFLGPVIVSGQRSTAGTYNADLGPSVAWGGVMFYDWRYPYQQDINTTRAYGFYGQELIGVDAVPSAIATNNIATVQNATSGTAFTLTAGTGISTLAAALTIPQTQATVPTGTFAIDGSPAVILFGQNNSVGTPDPATTITRAVSVTAASGAAGGAVLISGFDLYGAAMSESITVGVGVNTATGKKAFKFVSSAVPQFTDAINYTVGTSDVYGVPVRADRYIYAQLTWNNSISTTSSSFVVADTTSPATTTTGDIRGTWATATASDGAKRMQIFEQIAPSNCGTITGVFGVTQV